MLVYPFLFISIYMDYRDYLVEDFVIDPCFKEWVLHRKGAHNAFWELWIAQNPHKYDEIKEARQVILILNNLFNPEEAEEIDSRWMEVCN